jgi:nicotinamide phosphoribosyltransferase
MHDFAYRSVTTEEQAQIGGGAHLLNFMGTDNIQGILWAQDWYLAKAFPGYSVYASEHMISTAYGKGLGEREYVLALLKTFPKGKISIVADTYDVYKFTQMLAEDAEIKELILSRAPGDTVVVRPDSGNPPEVISKLLNILWNGFGGTYNTKGYKVLNPAIRIIQGDGIDFQMTAEILHIMKSNMFAPDNLVFGSGSALLNKNFDRDTQKFAFKASFIVINGQRVNVQKDPITSSGKKSKTGELILHPVSNGKNFMTFSSSDHEENLATFHSYVDALRVVFLNGEMLIEDDYDTIKDRVTVHFNHEKQTDIDFSQFEVAAA